VTDIPEEILLDLKVDEATVMKQLLNIEEKTKEVDDLVEKTGKKSKATWRLSVGVAQASWVLMDTLLSAAGVTISGIMRATISGAFAAIAIMEPILAATAVTPGMQFVAGIGFFQIALAIAAAHAAQIKSQDIETQLTTFKSGIGDVSSWVNSMTKFW